MGRNVLLLNALDCERYKCPFCVLVLDDPFQLECGSRICASCLETILKTNERSVITPMSRALNFYWSGARDYLHNSNSLASSLLKTPKTSCLFQ